MLSDDELHALREIERRLRWESPELVQLFNSQEPQPATNHRQRARNRVLLAAAAITGLVHPATGGPWVLCGWRSCRRMTHSCRSLATSLRKARGNSTVVMRVRGVHWLMIMPVGTFSAANRLVVPWRCNRGSSSGHGP